MGVGISYMGTKRELAGAVADAIAECQEGPLLDVFAGMCSVAETVAPSRPVWTNDAQIFAYRVAAALFTSQHLPRGSQAVADRFHDRFSARLAALVDRFGPALAAEDALLSATTFDDFEGKRLLLATALKSVCAHPRVSRYELFARQYSDSFLGVKQCLEVDAIVGTLRDTLQNYEVSEEYSWLKIALGKTMLRVANSTGHFAQFLTPKLGNFRTFQRQRRRRVWQEWIEANDDLEPVGTPDWRRHNKAFNMDTLALIPQLKTNKMRPGVIYADPPYTNDQYSRFYHLLETLMLYDYPVTTGKGRYRENRFCTTFSLKAQATAAMDRLIRTSSVLGSDIILSYPTNGLVHDSGNDPLEILRSHYRDVRVCEMIGHDHSTFGASKGAAKSSVTEMIYMGRI